jgi:hypothetical protein
MSSRSNPDLVYHLLAPALLFLTSFISFVTYNHYSYTTPEIWICLAGLAAIAFLCGLAGIVGGWPVRVVLTAALLLLWVDLQFDWWDESKSWPELRVTGVFVLVLVLSFAMRRHLSRIVTAVFATMLVSTVVLAAIDGPASPDSGAASAELGRPATTTKPTPRAHPELPILVHLILDEHIGIEGIPHDVPHGREMRQFLRDFFEMYGFRVFGRAYSRYATTRNALPNLVNFSSEPMDGALTSSIRPYVVVKNTYFELLERAGYEIHVSQSDYMDFCTASKEYIVQCANRQITGVKGLESLDVPVSDKVTLIYRRFADLSALKGAVGARYRRLREALRPAGWTLPEWWLKEEGLLGPLLAMPVFDDVTAAVGRASPGDMFFIHLLIPHSPYTIDAMCDLRPVQEWEQTENPGPGPPNDRESRARRYGLYLEQTRCLYRKLDAMFQAWQKAAIFDRLVIILHGDHGSRIWERDPAAKNELKLSHSDYIDTFSTLFAVKGPTHPPGYDRRVAPIERLLGEVVGGETGDDLSHVEQIPYVFLRDGEAQPMLRQPLPAFGDER